MYRWPSPTWNNMGSVTQGISEAMNEAFISMATSLAQLFGKKNRVHKLPLLINVEVLKLYMMSNIWNFFQPLWFAQFTVVSEINSTSNVQNRRLWTRFFLPISWASDVAMLMNASFIVSDIAWVTLPILFLVGDGHLSMQMYKGSFLMNLSSFTSGLKTVH